MLGAFYSYIRLLLFLAAALVGVQLPGFVAQYGNSLESHFLESAVSLEQFQDDARKFFNGDLAALISHYKANGDPVFVAGGESIEAVYNRHLRLKASLEAFNSGAWQAYTQSFFNPIREIQEEVRRNYSYVIKLDVNAILFGLLCGLIIAITGELLIRGFYRLVIMIFRRNKPDPVKLNKSL